ncbi:MAG TPA: transglycosylase domain-containing protein [Candidatus Binatia bacterium]|nr:transglycosylase domain-containing protein [Candidatus Binatia bacterium]
MAATKSGGRRRKTAAGNFTTRSGNSIKINQSLGEKLRSRRDDRSRRKAARLATLPKSRLKRWLFRMQPKRLAAYWFSRDGAAMALKITGAGILVAFVVLIGLFAYFRKDLPKINDISGDNLGGSISYYDSTGKVLLWQDYDAIKRTAISSDQIAPVMKQATVAIEDKNFYKEGAFSISGIIRAGLHDASSGGSSLQGGSTITEQLVKLNENWTGNRTIALKVKELILAVDVEREYTKDQILTAYLNIAPYGGVDYGVQTAAEDYFNENASQLTLPQAAFLASIPQSPSYYSPWSPGFSQSATQTREQYVIDQMATQGYITQAQAKAAIAVNVFAEVQPQQNRYTNLQDPYFVLAAKQQLDNEYGTTTVDRGGWKVTTTLNLGLQADAVKDVQANASSVAAVGGDEEAMVAEDVNTGQVVALVGGENFNNPNYGQINYANTLLSPGSSMKPFLYAGLIQNNDNVGAGSVLYDVQEPLPGYPCTNKAEPTATSNGGNCLWDDNFIYPGPETLRYALAGSRNVPAVKASYEIIPHDTSLDYTASVNKWIDMANAAIGTPNSYACYAQGVDIETAGANQQTQCYGAAAIGGGDISLDQEVNGDVTLGRLGAEVPQTYILNITDSAGKTIYQWQQPKSTQVYNPDTAYAIDDMLDDPRATYLQPYQKFQNYDGWDIAVKTGTENQEYNGVMTAWSTQYAVIGFAGYHTLDKPLEEGHFEDITEPITRTWMEQALDALHTKPINWVQPSNVKVLPSYIQRVSTGYGAEVPGPSTDVYPSWYTGGAVNGSKTESETVDKLSGDIATTCTPTLAKQTSQASDDNTFSVDIFWPVGQSASASSASSSAPTTTDPIHSCSDPPLVAPTVVIDDSSGNPATTDSSGNLSCPSGNCNIEVTLASPPPPDQTQGTTPFARYPITVNLLVNGQVTATQSIASSSNYSLTPFTYTPGSSSAQISIQEIDNALYSVSSSTQTVDPATTTTTPST